MRRLKLILPNDQLNLWTTRRKLALLRWALSDHPADHQENGVFY